MTDIVERLRSRATYHSEWSDYPSDALVLQEAASLIESQRAVIASLSEALEPFSDLGEVVLSEAPPDAVAAWSFQSSDGPHLITLETFRHARTALSEAKACLEVK